MAENGTEELRLLKAAFVFNFAKFTRWPEQAWGNTADPLKLCITGDDHLIDALKQLRGKTIQKRKVSILPLEDAQASGMCHMLYVARSEWERVPSLVDSMRDKPVLTISEIPNFARSGGIIELTERQDRIRFIINQDGAQRTGLKLSSRLLSLAINLSP